ncbi:hypothetical protein FB107DRAFT_280489 [Schizophyllum commune]
MLSTRSIQVHSGWSRQALSTRIPTIVVDSRAEATYLRPASDVLRSQTTLPSTFAFAIDLCLSHSTSAFRHRPPPHAVDLQATPHTHIVALRPPSTIAASSASKVESSSASKVESSSTSKDLRGKHNARRFLGSFDDHRIVHDKYKRREGKVTQVYRKKWVISRWLASITAARLIASITAARLLVPRPLQNAVVIPQSSHTIIPPPNRVAQ